MKFMTFKIFIFFLASNIFTEEIDFVPEGPTCNL